MSPDTKKQGMRPILKQISLIILFLNLTVITSAGGLASEEKGVTLTSRGEISLGSTLPPLLSEFRPGFASCGVVTSDLGWSPSHGSFFTEYHLDLFKNSGGKTVLIQMNYEAWKLKDQGNILGIEYPDYVKQLCDWGKEKGLSMWLSLFRWHFDGDQDTYLDKVAVIRNENGRRDLWIQWGREVIQKCRPHVIGTMCETTGAVYPDELRAFNQLCIDAWRVIDPNIWVAVYGGAWKHTTGGPLGVWKDKPLDYDRIIYDLHNYWVWDDYNLAHPYVQYYRDGEYTRAKQELYQWLDERFGNLVPNVWLGELGAYRKRSDETKNPEWKIVMKDFYSYCGDRDIGFTQFGFTKSTYPMLTSDHQALNEAGLLWRDYLT